MNEADHDRLWELLKKELPKAGFRLVSGNWFDYKSGPGSLYEIRIGLAEDNATEIVDQVVKDE